MTTEGFEVRPMNDAESWVATLGERVAADWSGMGGRRSVRSMVLPTTVFLDTSALAGQQYNFDSTAMRSFMKVARERKLKLLIPDPMEREVRRQIVERIGDLLTSLDLARRKAPFLAGWSELTRLNRLSKDAAEHIGMFAWSQFLGKLETEKLGCSTIAAGSMASGRAEECSSVAILRDYSARNGCVTAVISEDPDFKSECDRFPELLHFNSISALTELFLSDHASLGRIRSSVGRCVPLLEEEAREKVLGMPFAHENRAYRVERSDIHHVAILDPRIVSIEPAECTITFGVEVDATHQVALQPHGDEGRGEIIEISSTSGTAKVALDQCVEFVMSFDLDDTALYISSELCRAPW